MQEHMIKQGEEEEHLTSAVLCTGGIIYSTLENTKLDSSCVCVCVHACTQYM